MKKGLRLGLLWFGLLVVTQTLSAQFITFTNLTTVSSKPMPIGLAIGPDGNVYVSASHAIEKIDPATGTRTLIAGQPGVAGYQDGSSSSAMFNTPMGLVLDSSGVIFVADTYNNRIRRIGTDGVVSTLAGQFYCGSVNGNGSAAQFCRPTGVALDSAGNVWVADGNNNMIRRVTPNGDVTLVAGSTTHGSADGYGSAARFYIPSGIAFNGSDAFYVADQMNETIRKVSLSGSVTTIAGLAGSAGNVDGTGSAARFYLPANVAVAPDTGDIFVSDSSNYGVRRVSPAGVVTVAGGAMRGIGEDEGTGYAAQFDATEGIAALDSNDVFVADNAGMIKKGTPSIPDEARIQAPDGYYVGSALQLSVSPMSGSRFSWSIEKRPSSSTATFSDPASPSPYFVPDYDGDYTFRLDSGLPGVGTSITRVSAHVTCIAPPAAPTITRTSGNSPSCPGDPITFQASSGYDSYLWSVTNTVVGTGSSVTVSPLSTTQINAAGLVNGCTSANNWVYQDVVAQPSTPWLSYSVVTPACQNGTSTKFTVNGNNLEGHSLQWGYRTVLGGPISDIPGKTGYSYVLDGRDFPAVGTYYLVCRVIPVCGFQPRVTADMQVAIVSPLSVSLTPSVADGCPDTYVTLTATASGRNDYANVSIWIYYGDGTGLAYCYGKATCTSPQTRVGLSYYARTYDASCSALSDTVDVIQDPAPSYPGFSWGATCDGVKATITSPQQNTTYLWSNGVIGTSMIPAVDGYYSVKATNSYGCSTSSAASFIDQNFPPTPVVSASGPTAFCRGGNVTLTASAGFFSYLWSNGATSQSIVVSSPGEYTVTTRDTRGCVKTSDPVAITVYDPPSPPVISASGATTFCEGGEVTLSAPAGFSYHWSNGATTQSISVTSSGLYSVTVTDANGCSSASLPMNVTVNPKPIAAITPEGPLTFCTGGTVVLSGPPGMSTYEWSNGATTPSISVSASGSYVVSVTNANGCSATSAATVVTVNPLPETPLVTASGPTTFCEGGTVTLTAPSGYVAYSWSSGSTSQSITVDSSGAYAVTVTNENGCTATSAPIAVAVNPLPVATITSSGPTTFCEGGSVTLTASAGSSFLWSTGATSQSISVSSGDSYHVAVTSDGGCTSTSSPVLVTVTPAPAQPVVSASGPTTFCEGGSVTLTAPGGLNYHWTTGETSQSISVRTSGSYAVTVTNASGCSATSEPVSVTVHPAVVTPVISAGGPTTFCDGGSVVLTAPAASSYLWSNGATTQSITVGSSGGYSVTVADENGCAATSVTTVVTVNLKPPVPNISASGPTTFCEGGTVTLTAPAGYTYSWSNGATTQSITVASTGDYSVSVSNANGCIATSSPITVVVNPLPVPTVTPSGATTFCEGGSVILSAPAGMTSYLWSSGATTQSITVNASGLYTVSVTNSVGCVATSSPVAVNVNPNPQVPSITAGGPTSICPGGSVVLTASPAAAYLWSTGATTQSIAAANAGAYTVTAFNTSGCATTSSPVSVNWLPATTITQQPQSVTIARNTSTTLSANATGTGTVSYSWYRGQSGDTSQSLNVKTSTYKTPRLKAGTYYYWVRATAACGTADSITAIVTVP